MEINLSKYNTYIPHFLPKGFFFQSTFVKERISLRKSLFKKIQQKFRFDQKIAYTFIYLFKITYIVDSVTIMIY